MRQYDCPCGKKNKKKFTCCSAIMAGWIFGGTTAHPTRQPVMQWYLLNELITWVGLDDRDGSCLVLVRWGGWCEKRLEKDEWD